MTSKQGANYLLAGQNMQQLETSELQMFLSSILVTKQLLDTRLVGYSDSFSIAILRFSYGATDSLSQSHLSQILNIFDQKTVLVWKETHKSFLSDR